MAERRKYSWDKNMSYEENWKVLADLLTELRKKGEKIPTHIMNDLRSAKTMIQILKADPTHMKYIYERFELGYKF